VLDSAQVLLACLGNCDRKNIISEVLRFNIDSISVLFSSLSAINFYEMIVSHDLGFGRFRSSAGVAVASAWGTGASM